MNYTRKSLFHPVIPVRWSESCIPLRKACMWSVDAHGLTPKLIFLSDSGAIAETSTTSRQQQQQLGLLDRWLGPEAIPSSPGACGWPTGDRSRRDLDSRLTQAGSGRPDRVIPRVNRPDRLAGTRARLHCTSMLGVFGLEDLESSMHATFRMKSGC